MWEDAKKKGRAAIEKMIDDALGPATETLRQLHPSQPRFTSHSRFTL